MFIAPLHAEQRKVRVGTFPAAPMVFIKDNKPEGLFIDLIEYFAKTLNWKIEYVYGTWDQQLLRLEKGEIDLLPAVGYNEDRKMKYDFSRNPVYIDSGVLFTGKKFFPHTVFDLKGKRIAALKGSIFTTAFIEYAHSFGVNCEIILTNDNKTVFTDMDSGKADAGVLIYSLGNELARDYSATITPISFSPIALEFAVPKGRNADIIEGIDRLMMPMIGDPLSLYSRSFKKWTMPHIATNVPIWIWWGIVSLLGSGVFLASWTYILKKQVIAKTKHLTLEIAEHTKAQECLSITLNEKETLLRELYHRTKNTLQVIKGMVVLQSADYPDNDGVQQLVKTTEDRIQAISLVHQILYRSKDLSRISIKDYIQELTAHIMSSYVYFDNRIKILTDIEEHFLLLDTAIPFGLILNELVTNSLKHAFPDNRDGIISISLKGIKNDGIVFTYSDNGIGVPEGFDFRAQSTLGLRLIYSIGEMQLLGHVTFSSDHGVSCMIEMTTGLYRERI
jgi:two-component sensor histidine kinase/ABC-type amino acid transport substrate-binding protein